MVGLMIVKTIVENWCILGSTNHLHYHYIVNFEYGVKWVALTFQCYD